jgi:hypothetical protein
MPRALKDDPLQEELPLMSIASHKLFPGRTSLYVSEVARALHISCLQVRNLIEEGKIKGVNIAGKNTTLAKYWRIPVAAYDAFIKENQS